MGTNDEGPSRRDALKVGAMVATATGLSAVLGAIPRQSRASGTGHATVKYGLADPASIVSGTCAGCTGGCPIRTARADGVVAKVDGNPYSPRQGGDPLPDSAAHAARLRGASCARGQSRVNVVHDPWRLVRPLVRDGSRGSMAFRTPSTEAWISAVLPAVVDAHRASLGSPPDAPPRVVIAVDPRHVDRRPALTAVARAVAGARVVLGHPAPRLALASAEGVGPGWLAAPRWDRATLRVAWGADPVASGLDPVGSARGIAGHRASTVVIDPRLSSTAAMAGQWLPVRAGADGDLAAWVAARWVARGALGADQVPAAILARPDGEWERRTGLGRDLVDALAARMLAAGPGLAVAIGGGLSPAAAVLVLRLCAHVGALGPTGAMAPAADPIPAVDGARALRDLVVGDHPPAVLIVVGGGGVRDTPYEAEVLAALSDPGRVGLVVAVQTAPGPFLAVADAVLPDVTELERFGLAARHDGTSVALPVIAPVPSATVDGPLGHGLEGLLDAIAAGVGSELRVEAAVAERVNAAATGLAPLSPEDDAALTASVGTVGWATPAARALLLRGWVPPTPSEPPAVAMAPWVEPESAPAAEVVLIGWTEPFGGTPDADAQVWGGRSVRRANVAQVHPATVAGLGEPTGYLRIGARVVEARVTEEVRPGVVALARGYGQRVGYTGDWVVDGVAMPADPARCDGVALGGLANPDGSVSLAWEPPPPEPGWIERLMTGPRLVYRPGETS